MASISGPTAKKKLQSMPQGEKTQFEKIEQESETGMIRTTILD